MEHIKKYWSFYFLLAVAVIILVLNWNKWFGTKTSGTTKPADGTPCKTADNMDGVYVNGTCVTSGRPGGGNGGNGGGGTGDANSAARGSNNSPSTYCMARNPGVACPPRICYINGKFYTNSSSFVNCGPNAVWYILDPSKSTASQCCYKK